jgi:hypothetical protein
MLKNARIQTPLELCCVICGCFQSQQYSTPLSSLTVPYDPLWPTKPEFPEGGASLTCPACDKTSTFQRFQLMYRQV